MTVHVFFYFIKRVEKEIKCEDFRAFSSFSRIKFNKFNDTGARMLNSTLKRFLNRVFAWKTLIFCHTYATLLRTLIHNAT